MAWDSKSTPARRRGNSVASNASRGLRTGPRPPTQPKSAHVADPFLHDFLAPSFDAAAYLNATLPPLQTSTGASSSSSSSSASRSTTNQGGATTAAATAVPLSEVSLQAQSVLSQLNAHTTRLTNTLTELTDEILRSGSRLAYEVELLRGETLSLAETLTEGLQEDVTKFVPGGIYVPEAQPAPAVLAATTPGEGGGAHAHQRRLSVIAVPPSQQQPQPETPAATTAPAGEQDQEPQEPPHITQLRTLTLVRSRLDSVIQTFGSAIDFVFPPSEVSAVSSFLSVSAPAPSDSGGPGSNEDPDSVASTEEKGQKVLQALRDEISSLLEKNNKNEVNDPIKGIEEAAKRVGELKELVKVWKGTAEERGRVKFVEGLARMVEERHAALVRELESGGARKGDAAAAAGSGSARSDAEAALRRVVGGGGGEAEQASQTQTQTESKGLGGYGLISQLNKFRNGL